MEETSNMSSSGQENVETSQEKTESGGAERERKALLEEIERLKSEKRDLEDTLRRLKADFDNFKRNKEREMAEFRELASSGVICDILRVLDNLERAIQSASQVTDVKDLATGVEMIYKEMRNILESHGVKEISALNCPFDPLYHEAIMQVEDPERENIVVQEIKKGYTMKGRLLRPAQVVVSKKVEDKGGEQEGPSQKNEAEVA